SARPYLCVGLSHRLQRRSIHESPQGCPGNRLKTASTGLCRTAAFVFWRGERPPEKDQRLLEALEMREALKLASFYRPL
ncbi:MAG: hypothetical protein PHU21_06840, partial [Elusimicrobia bacterium]|nr:hypothetical protein [Elusimicrobiota bacterium]